MTRTRRFDALSSVAVHARPHVSEVEPSVYGARLVVRVDVVLPVVQCAPPSHDSWTQNRGDRLALLIRPRSSTWMPRIVAPRLPREAWVATSLSRAVLVQLVLFALPLLTSEATAASGAPVRLTRLVS